MSSDLKVSKVTKVDSTQSFLYIDTLYDGKVKL